MENLSKTLANLPKISIKPCGARINKLITHYSDLPGSIGQISRETWKELLLVTWTFVKLDFLVKEKRF